MPTSNDFGPTGTGDVGRWLGCCTRGSCVCMRNSWGKSFQFNLLLKATATQYQVLLLWTWRETWMILATKPHHACGTWC